MLATDDDDHLGSLDALKFSLASDIIELIVLTSDETFLQTMRDAVGSARRLWHVSSGDKVSDLLIAGGVGIVVLDVQALIGPTKGFLTQIERQFPDLVIVVAGTRDDETELASLISAGTIYRFIHKPMSPARARLFTEAAVRKLSEKRLRAAQTPVPQRESKASRVWMIGVALVAILGVASLLWAQRPSAVDKVTHLPAVKPVTTSIEPLLLSRAASALAANHLTAPPGDNALDLYLQAQAHDPGDAQARAGVAEVYERLLAHVENALLEERLDEAAQAIETARRAGVESGRIAFLAAQLAKASDQSKAAQSQLRVKGGPKAPEESSLPDGHVTPQSIDEAADPAQERLQQDRLIEPANDNAAIGVSTAEVVSLPQQIDTLSAQQRFLANIVPSAQLTLLKTVKPTYPSKAVADKLQGWVELDFTVGESGEVKDVAVHAASMPGVFDAAAIKAVSQWHYQPILQDGKPVAERTRVRIRFADPYVGAQ